MLPERSRRRLDLADRISVLPDSVLRVILSNLVTKEAVATSVLSRRWKCVWMSVPSLDFHFHFDNHGNRYTEFSDFVDHVLDVNTCSLLNKFKLVWYPKSISPSVTDFWIQIAISKNLRALCLRPVGDPSVQRIADPYPSVRSRIGNLSLCCEHDYNFMCLNSYVIPGQVFCCESLHSLELINCTVSIDDQTMISLPNLETLTMAPVAFNSEHACQEILSGCPLLKFLHLNISKGDFHCTISSDTLIHLELCFDHPSVCSFIVTKAPALEYLNLKGGLISEIEIGASLDSLVEAHFDDVHFYRPRQSNDSIVQAVCAFRFVRVLTLSFDALQALATGPISLSTEFKRLVKLVAGTCSSVIDLIYHTVNLRLLVIQKDEDDAIYGSHFNYQSKRNILEEVPTCLSNSLKEVRIMNYNGLKDENEMIRYILQHGSVLEVMEITCTGGSRGSDDDSSYSETRERKFNKMKENISKFPRMSPACQVRFSCIYY